MSNFLDARCPTCGDAAHLDVAAVIWVRLTPDGTDAEAPGDGSHEYTEKSTCVCRACGHAEPLSAFENAGASARRAAAKEAERGTARRRGPRQSEDRP